MQARVLGGSGVAVSPIVLGLGNVGGIGSAPELFGVAGESAEEALSLMDAACEAGITTFDTAASYGGGRSEQAIGMWLATRRRPAVVATKVFHSVGGDPRDSGLAPARIHRELAASLVRLGLERVDLYLIHEPDPAVPLGDTLEALDELVRRDVVGAIGASNVDGAYLEEALAISAERGLARFEWVQNSYSLLDREPERDVFPICEREGLGFTPFSPLAGGWLTGKYRRGEPYPDGSRMSLRPGPYAGFEADEVFDALEAFQAEALARGVEPAALALAWVLSHPTVTAAVVGPRRPSHLDPALVALELELTPRERDDLSALFADPIAR
jgi:aryl-alcohol dehydrogenase-like predicted oxidoreductase